jgi:hypothetical protein
MGAREKFVSGESYYCQDYERCNQDRNFEAVPRRERLCSATSLLRSG